MKSPRLSQILMSKSVSDPINSSSSGKIVWQDVDGVLLLDKPLGPSSNHAMQQARRLMKARKAGHGGTLDPLASGLLPVCFGEATKFSASLLDADKTYVATVRLGEKTTTGDAEGEVLEARPVNVTFEQIQAVVAQFRGAITQCPPMYSALKHQGRPLYELARQGIEVERVSRQVTIHRLDVIACNAPLLEIEVDCSKGTYIRTLAEDMGAALGCGAHLAALRRTRIGPLSLQQAVTLDQLQSAENPLNCLLPIDSVLASWPALALPSDLAKRLLQGQRLAKGSVVQPEHCVGKRCRLYSDGRFIGIGQFVDDVLQPCRLIGTSGEDKF